MNFIIRIIISSMAVLITAWFLPHVKIDDFTSALLTAVVLAFLNNVIKPILTVLTIPITFITLGFFLLVLNACMILLAAKLIDGFHVDGFWWALIFSLILSITTGILNALFGPKQKEEE